MKVKLNNVRIAYAQGLWTPKEGDGPGAKAKYGCSFLLSKNHPDLKAIEDAVKAVAKEKWGEQKYMTILKQAMGQDRLPVHNGDNKPTSAGYEGNLYINGYNELKPTVVDQLAQPVSLSDGVVYSGCYVNAFVDIWAQDNKFGKRVNASVMGVQKVSDGEKLAGGSVVAASEFEAIPQEALADAEDSGDGAGSIFNT